MATIMRSIVFMLISITSAEFININWNVESVCVNGKTCYTASFPVDTCYVGFLPDCYECLLSVTHINTSTKYQILVFEGPLCDSTPKNSYIVDTDHTCHVIGVTDWAAVVNVSSTNVYNNVALFYPEEVPCARTASGPGGLSSGAIALIVILSVCVLLAIAVIFWVMYNRSKIMFWTRVDEG